MEFPSLLFFLGYNQFKLQESRQICNLSEIFEDCLIMFNIFTCSGAIFTKGLSQVSGLSSLYFCTKVKPKTWLRPFVNTAPAVYLTFLVLTLLALIWKPIIFRNVM